MNKNFLFKSLVLFALFFNIAGTQRCCAIVGLDNKTFKIAACATGYFAAKIASFYDSLCEINRYDSSESKKALERYLKGDRKCRLIKKNDPKNNQKNLKRECLFVLAHALVVAHAVNHMVYDTRYAVKAICACDAMHTSYYLVKALNRINTKMLPDYIGKKLFRKKVSKQRNRVLTGSSSRMTAIGQKKS